MEVSHQAAATRYVFERFLVRLGECEVWNKRLVLKGAMALIGVTQDHQRTTTDIDVWAIDKLTREEAIEAFKAIASVTPSDADPVTFNLDTLKVESINTKADEPGHQITCEARIGNKRLKFKLEISHGHVCTPKLVMMTYPTVLDGHAPAKIMAYNAETMLAEKVHAIVSLGTHTSRYNDFYDVALIMKKCDLDGHDNRAGFQAHVRQPPDGYPGPGQRKAPRLSSGFFR
ncbi:nucleotidyl transferase AbiEii/AbiGii toxin family protein [Bradyrhizobium japonicum]|uniref:nucleotidyl transferase AbiEii/AbiGii toxin family protein n=1 Tax=Bradyrhizobium japonicum TaxID=375 RepID=UPI001BAC2B77|nr:nucleotidyl transferase AbiEii/AbiGii toxin family protein [Bradyrhizobium japonicum]